MEQELVGFTIDSGYVYEVAEGSHCIEIWPAGQAYGQ